AGRVPGSIDSGDGEAEASPHGGAPCSHRGDRYVPRGSRLHRRPPASSHAQLAAVSVAGPEGRDAPDRLANLASFDASAAHGTRSAEGLLQRLVGAVPVLPPTDPALLPGSADLRRRCCPPSGSGFI